MKAGDGSARAAYDVAVVGGGTVGALLAVALGRAGARVAVIEARASDVGAASPLEERPIALSAGTRAILETLDVWPHLAAAAAPIEHIHVSDRGRPGAARIHARDLGVEALGHVVPAWQVAQACRLVLERTPGVLWRCPALVEALEVHDDAVALQIDGAGGQERLEARLAVGADGSASPVVRLLGLSVETVDYGQSALSATVATTRAHGGVAYERFTADGPMALLPMREGRSGLVWTTRPEVASALADMTEEAFLACLQQAFGTRLGGFVEAGSRAVHPLRATRVREQIRARAVVVGNAAHTLHPVAGQGLNLGMRDAAVLAEHVAMALGAGDDPGARPLLESYQEARRRDQDLIFGATDLLVRLFSNDVPGLGLVRGAGLVAFDLLGPLKRAFARHAMGLAGRQSRLARGLLP
jgi:2-octaprenyl-6-methoxyphenol hydroxylase